jgi:hypothetical protein
VRWRWSSELPVVERRAQVGCPIDEVYAEFRGDTMGPVEILLIEDEPPNLLVWELNMRGLRDARLRVEFEPDPGGGTRVSARLDARVVGRLRLQRARLAGAYADVVAGMLDRTCAALESPSGAESDETPGAVE